MNGLIGIAVVNVNTQNRLWVMNTVSGGERRQIRWRVMHLATTKGIKYKVCRALTVQAHWMIYIDLQKRKP